MLYFHLGYTSTPSQRTRDSQISGVNGRGRKGNVPGGRSRDRTCHSGDAYQIKGWRSPFLVILSLITVFQCFVFFTTCVPQPEMRSSDNTFVSRSHFHELSLSLSRQPTVVKYTYHSLHKVFTGLIVSHLSMHLSVQVHATVLSPQDSPSILLRVRDHLGLQSAWCLTIGMSAVELRMDSLNARAESWMGRWETLGIMVSRLYPNLRVGQQLTVSRLAAGETRRSS